MSDIRKYINIIDQYDVNEKQPSTTNSIEPQGLTRYVDLIESSMRVDESFKDAEVKFSDENDPAEVKKYIEQFKQLAQKNIIKGQDKDIGKWIKAGWVAFKELVDASSKVTTKGDQKRRVKSDSITVYQDDEKMVIIPLTEKASCYYGKNTQWCTAATESENQFEHYFGDLEVTLFYVMFKDGRKYACATTGPDGYEFFDENDKSMNKAGFEYSTGILTDQIDQWYKENSELVEKAREKFTPTGKLKEILSQFHEGKIPPDKVVQEINFVIENDEVITGNYNDVFTIHNIDKDGNFIVDIDKIIDPIDSILAYFNGDRYLEIYSDEPDYESCIDALDSDWKARIFQYLYDNHQADIKEFLEMDDDDSLSLLDIERNFSEIMEHEVDDELNEAFTMAVEDATRSNAEGDLLKHVTSYINDNLNKFHLQRVDNIFSIIDNKNTAKIENNDVIAFVNAIKEGELEEYNFDYDIDDGIDYDFLPEALKLHLNEVLPDQDDE